MLAFKEIQLELFFYQKIPHNGDFDNNAQVKTLLFFNPA
jgi:hypothetical protein